MAQSRAGQDNVKIELTSIFFNAMQANVKLLMGSVRMVNRATTRQENVGEAIRDGASDAVNMMGEYLKSSVDSAVRLIDLGVNYTGKLLSEALETPRLTREEPEITGPPVELLLSGAPGSTCSAGITIGNDKSYPVDASFVGTGFRSADGSLRLPARMSFEPSSFRLAPSEKRRVAVMIEVPADAQAGVYHADVAIHGVPQIRLRFVLEVTGNAGEISISA